MNLTDEQRSLLWLSCAEISASRVHRLVEEYGSAQEIWNRFGTGRPPHFQEVSGEKLNRMHSREAMEQMALRLEKSHVRLLFEADEAYPELLRCIDDPPYLLYYAGRLSCLKQPMVGVVGTRKVSDYGAQMARSIARGLAEAGVTVVSGLARGVDTAAHQGALDGDGCTVGVLGCGVNAPYPPENTPLLRRIAGGKGLIVSEYPLDAEPTAFHFPYRNRIISGMSQGVVFVEGAVKSGGMHTVNAALVQGRQVFAVPGRVGTVGAEGPHAILREGARIVTSGEDILDDLELTPLSAAPATEAALPSDPAQRAIVEALRRQPMTLDQLAASLNADGNETMTLLCMMEISGLVNREAGNLFSAPI